MKSALTFLFIFFMITACSKSTHESSLVVIKADTLSTSSGGLMMWGVSRNANESVALSFTSETETKSVILANGDWQFSGVSWSGPNAMEGNLKCGFISKTLSGGVINFTLAMNADNCDDLLFSTSTFLNGLTFAPLKVLTCNENTARADINGNSCDSYLGKAKSFKVVFPEFLPGLERNSGTGLTSSCHNINDTDSSELTNLFVPVGTTSFNVYPGLFATMIRLYSGINCGAGFLYKVADYPLGLLEQNEHPNFPGAGVSLLRSVNSGSNISYLFIKDDRIPPGNPAKLTFTNNTYVAPNTCTTVFVVTVKDANSLEVPSGIARTVGLVYTATTQDLTFYSDPSCTSAISELSFDADTTNRSFYVKKATVGQTTVYAATAGLLNASSIFNVVNAGTVVKLDIKGLGGGAATPFGAAGTCISAYSVKSLDLNSDPANVTSDTTITLSYSGTQDGGFYTDAGCTTPTTTVTISNGASLSGNVYFKKTTSGTVSIYATGTGIDTAYFAVNVTAI
ncbi:MAG: hypothetical protein A2X86_11455 [Bdellovibrionales bacterium GWA2_49_15]|nr:MAG: hypothetical protein A2X86_11455 [Bdellovibrionales bacterium GWA2_49_15]HAZ12633.1 hypothetical protein [Bdellovibrionales bacterium]